MHVSLRSCFRRIPSLLRPLESTSSCGPLPFKRCLSSSVVTTAHSIRNVVANGEFNRGYQLFTEFYTNEHQKSITSASNEQSVRPKSPYLAHVLIHALYRSQRPLTAASVTKMCMERGFKIRGHTFTTIFAGISPPCDFTVSVARPNRSKKSPRMASINAALGLLKAARSSGHKRHSWMYDSVINALLLQGEVLTAALLFITLLNEWNTLRLVKGVEEARPVEEGASGADIHGPLPATASRRMVIPVEPQGIWIQKIGAALEERINDPGDSTSDRSKMRTMQALVSLVDLLKGSHQHLPGRHHILQILRSAISTGFVDDPTSEYFRSVILRLCQQSRKKPGLDLFSYHVLLRYALQDQKSIDLGVDILRALVESHDPTLVTYNILLREISRLGDVGTVEAMARLLNNRNCFTMEPLRAETEQRGQKEIIECLSSRPIPRLDEYTVVAMMGHAIARGDSTAACEYVIQMFPELSDSKNKSGRHQAHRNVEKQAKQLSPYFWATAQRAAAMSGRLKLSTRIWRLVMRMEKMQYNPVIGDMVPCLYGAPAYTSQFQFFSTKLQKISKNVQELPAGKMDKKYQEHIQAVFRRYNQILVYIERVLLSLKERSLGNSDDQKTVISGFELDKRLTQALFVMVERILTIERQGLPALAHSEANPSQEEPSPEHYNEYVRPRRILGVLRRIFHHHRIPHPHALEVLGFKGYADESMHSLDQQHPGPCTRPNLSVPSRQPRKQPAFKVKYSAVATGSQRPPKRPSRQDQTQRDVDSEPAVGNDRTKRFIQMLEHARSVTVKAST